MSNIRVDLSISIYDGLPVTFKSPADCSQVTGLIVYYPNGDTTTSKVFQFADAHGNNIGDLDLFAANVVVKVILDTDTNLAFVQNADTNAYLEARFEELENKASNIVVTEDDDPEDVDFWIDEDDDSTVEDAHINNMNNPHKVTIAQVGGVKKSGDTMTGMLSIQNPGLPGKATFTHLYDANAGGTFAFMRAEQSDGSMYNLWVNSKGPQYQQPNGVVYDLLHTGNAYDKTAADALFADNDPKKWGLGTIAKKFSTGDDLNNYTVCGFFGHHNSDVINSLLNKPPYDFNGGEVELLVIANQSGYLTQILHNSYNGVTAQRDIKGSTVGEWGYVNPLMKLGVEYRTTEFYLGNPVYVRAIETTEKLTKGVARSVAYCPEGVGQPLTYGGYILYPNSVGDDYITGNSVYPVEVSVSRVNIIVTAKSENHQDCTARLFVKYTKKTD